MMWMDVGCTQKVFLAKTEHEGIHSSIGCSLVHYVIAKHRWVEVSQQNIPFEAIYPEVFNSFKDF